MVLSQLEVPIRNVHGRKQKLCCLADILASSTKLIFHLCQFPHEEIGHFLGIGHIGLCLELVRLAEQLDLDDVVQGLIYAHTAWGCQNLPTFGKRIDSAKKVVDPTGDRCTLLREILFGSRLFKNLILQLGHLARIGIALFFQLLAADNQFFNLFFDLTKSAQYRVISQFFTSSSCVAV